MTSKISNLFLLLVLVQASHSIEEYFGHLWDVFPPAIWLTSVFSNDRHLSFVIINITLFIVGLLFWLLLIKRNHFLAKTIIWFWIIVEVTNGLMHIFWSISDSKYIPGLITAPVLVIVAVYLAKVYLSTKKKKELN